MKNKFIQKDFKFLINKININQRFKKHANAARISSILRSYKLDLLRPQADFQNVILVFQSSIGRNLRIVEVLRAKEIENKKNIIIKKNSQLARSYKILQVNLLDLTRSCKSTCQTLLKRPSCKILLDPTTCQVLPRLLARIDSWVPMISLDLLASLPHKCNRK